MYPDIRVHTIRGSSIESIHHGNIAVVNIDGNDYHTSGNAATAYARSTAKLLQAITVMEMGAVDQFQLSDEEVVLLCASHNGEPAHTGKVQSIITKLGLDTAALQCGTHEPFHKETANQLLAAHQPITNLHNNCSGKHAGMLALCLKLGVSTDGYLSIDHPVQQAMKQTVKEMCEMDTMDGMYLGTDGCGVPVFGMPIRQLALAYAHLGAPKHLSPKRAEACNRILNCLTKHPYFLAGTDRFDTRLIEVTQGKIIGKMGAEGIFALTVPEKSLGLVIKIEDGSQRAIYPAVVEALMQLKLLSPSELKQLAPFHVPMIYNWNGQPVGRIQPVVNLRC